MTTLGNGALSALPNTTGSLPVGGSLIVFTSRVRRAMVDRFRPGIWFAHDPARAVL